MVSTEKCYLKWDSFLENLTRSFEDQTHNQDFSDVTLVCEDNQQIMAHSVILSASSPILQQMLKSFNHSHPLLYFWDIKHRDLVKLVEFMYSGQTTVYQSDLPYFLEIAKNLGVKGVSEQMLQEKENPLEGSLVLLDHQSSPNILQSPKKKIPSEEIYGLADHCPVIFGKNTGEMFVPEPLENGRHQGELYKEVHTKETLHHIRKPQQEYGKFVKKPNYNPEINGDSFNENLKYNKLEGPNEMSVLQNLHTTKNKYIISEETKEATTLRHEQELDSHLFKKEDVWQKQQKSSGCKKKTFPFHTQIWQF